MSGLVVNTRMAEAVRVRNTLFVAYLHVELDALGTTDPVALLGHDPFWPLDDIQIVQQLLGVVGDAEVPLLQVPTLDGIVGALTPAVDHLLVGQHRLAAGTPVDGGVLSVGDARLEELEEDPLGPTDVVGVVAAHLAAPVVDATDACQGTA